MRYYRRKRYANKTAKKVFLRILFVMAAAVIITGLAILLGNHIKTMVEEADRMIQSADTAYVSGDNSRPAGYYAMELPTEEEISVFAVGVNIDSESDLTGQLEAVKANFDTVSVDITDNGKLVYVSPAMLSFARMPADEIMTEAVSESYNQIKNLGTAVKTENLRMCAVMEVSCSDGSLVAEADKALLTELAGFGFDEVILTGFESVSEGIPAYLAGIANDMISVGVVFPVEAYLDEDNDKVIQRISASGVFLCVDLGMDQHEADEINKKVRKLCSSLRNSFDSLHLRVIIDADDPAVICAEYTALMASNIENIQITNEISYEALSADLPDDMQSDIPAAEETSSETGAAVNPYITTTVDEPEPETEAESETETEAEAGSEEYYRSEGSWY